MHLSSLWWLFRQMAVAFYRCMCSGIAKMVHNLHVNPPDVVTMVHKLHVNPPENLCICADLAAVVAVLCQQL